MKLIATCTGITPGSWQLLHDPARDSRTWRALVLVRPIEAGRRSRSYHSIEAGRRSRYYHFGWNGDRLSVTPDFHVLRVRFPLVMDWVNETLPTVTWWGEKRISTLGVNHESQTGSR